jgi:hypothetical protein
MNGCEFKKRKRQYWKKLTARRTDVAPKSYRFHSGQSVPIGTLFLDVYAVFIQKLEKDVGVKASGKINTAQSRLKRGFEILL